jgi:BirA family biotin operon repressor/biotin-[acetyl-CoA-carboxylase] ligase
LTHKDTSKEMLAILQKASGNYVSGEYLSQCLGITRAAIWKRMAVLKKEGFVIEASTRKGYRLCEQTRPYGRLSVQQGLVTRSFGRELKFLETVDSTNNYLKQMAYEGAPEGTVVLADEQTAGRGRLGRSFLSSPGKGIWMSLLLRPELHPSQVHSLTLAASVAVARVLEPLNIPGCGIKWPNDILIGGKKVCGILTEMSAEMDRVAWVIIGIGLNVNHTAQDFPEDLKELATSLYLSRGIDEFLERSSLAANMINQLEEIYLNYLEKGSSWVVEQWKKYNLTLGKRVRLISTAGEMVGCAEDLLPDGRLILVDDSRQRHEVLSGEISLREL